MATAWTWGRALAIGLALAAGSAGASAAAPVEYRVSARGEIEIGPDGLVRDFRLESKHGPQVTGAIEQNVRSWTFEPIFEEGRPVIARTGVHLSLVAEPIANGQLALRVDSVWFGLAEQHEGNRKPVYPSTALNELLGAEVLLALRLDADGRVVDAHAIQVSLAATGRPAAEERRRGWFRAAALRAAMHWRYEISEIVDGQSSETTVLQPIRFRIGHPSTDDSAWVAYKPGPKSPIPWQEAEADAEFSVADLADGEARPLASRFKLREPVAGTLL